MGGGGEREGAGFWVKREGEEAVCCGQGLQHLGWCLCCLQAASAPPPVPHLDNTSGSRTCGYGVSHPLGGAHLPGAPAWGGGLHACARALRAVGGGGFGEREFEGRSGRVTDVQLCLNGGVDAPGDLSNSFLGLALVDLGQ